MTRSQAKKKIQIQTQEDGRRAVVHVGIGATLFVSRHPKRYSSRLELNRLVREKCVMIRRRMAGEI